MAEEREPEDVTTYTRPPDKRALSVPLGCIGVLLVLGVIGAIILGMR